MKVNLKNNTRLVTGVILVVLLAVLLWLRGWYFGVAAVICIGIAINEEFKALKIGGHNPVSWPTWAASIACLPLQMLMPDRAIIIPILSLMILTVIVVVVNRHNPDIMDIFISVLPMISVALPGMCLISLLGTQPHSLQIVLLTMIFTVSVGSDTMAYEVGRRYGKTKLCKDVSPNKTVEGAIGGVIGGTVLALATGGIAAIVAPEAVLPSFIMLVVIGAVGSMVSQCGDLFASLVKRHCNIKDFGNMFPGHGGMLDRLDSILFMVVFIYCIKLLVY